MKAKTPFYIAIVMGILGNPLSAQNKSETDREIAKVESGLMPVTRFEGEKLWTLVSRMKHYNVPGVSIAVIKNSKVIWSKTYGLADVESNIPVNSRTLFQAASMSKPVSVYAALSILKKRKLDPDADVNTYLTSWKIPDNQFTKDKKVSLKNIASHTAGFTVSGFPGYEPGKPVPTLIQVLNGQNPANTSAVVVDQVPGKSFRYAGGGYCVMQQMLIDIEKKDFPTIMKENVLQPLDMKNSTFVQPLPESQVQWAATAYNMDGKRVQGRYHTYPEMAAAGLWTTAEDLAGFVIDIQNTLGNKSTNIVSQKTAEEFTSPFFDKFEGLGIFLENRKGETYFTHGGWNEGFSSRFIAGKTSGDGVVILTNTNKPDFIEELVRSVAAVYHWPGYTNPVNKILPLKEEDFRHSVGRYRFNNYGLYRVYREKGKLMMSINDIENPVELIKVGENAYTTRNWDYRSEFVKNIETGKPELVQVLQDKTIHSRNPQLGKDENTPLELILEGNFDKGLAAFRKAKTENSDHYFLSEDFLNNVAYSQLREKKYTKGIDVFRTINALYPENKTVYESLGEAYLKAGKKENAKQAYRKALEINPENENAAKALKTL
ncbi:beta-lactamase family protein [Chryseobacterium arthrosphaerae]|uniref:beta-lactamase family protein n=1 Tax=Chryseobacterium arthrosphaerae TaxID=651561 RepID=UPI0023E2858E|nr:beta-lactamase family protein [Chryseobacterium arthrosphaerae]WES98388.1 beta-lactamase family protein [Chryseobacterium arthrosphaerae]